ncbi:hypothetical protein Ancab_015489 [Ancistrocladus abbreviatus]
MIIPHSSPLTSSQSHRRRNPSSLSVTFACNPPLSHGLTPLFVKTKRPWSLTSLCSLSSSTSVAEEEGSPPIIAPPSEIASLGSDVETEGPEALPLGFVLPCALLMCKGYGLWKRGGRKRL